MKTGILIGVALYSLTKMVVILLNSIEHDQTLEEWIAAKNAPNVNNEAFAPDANPGALND